VVQCQSSWLQIRRSGLDSRRYQIFQEVVSLERGPLCLVSTIEELLDRKGSGSDLESREYGRRVPSRWPRGTFYPQNLALTSPTSGGRSVGRVRSRTQDTEFNFLRVNKARTTPVQPQSDGTVERYIRPVEQHLRIVVWDVRLPVFLTARV
jgi:hypothetical protein